jgi:hypothetical protein
VFFISQPEQQSTHVDCYVIFFGVNGYGTVVVAAGVDGGEDNGRWLWEEKGSVFILTIAVIVRR